MNEKNHYRKDVYQQITDRIIEQLEQGIVPWKKPWTEAGLPKNLISLKPYKGINVLLLSSLGYKRNLFVSFREVQELGAMIKQGEKPHMVVFWKWKPVFDVEKNETKQVPSLRYYLVFNVDQCEGIPESMIPIARRPNNPEIACERIIERLGNRPNMHFHGHQDWYDPFSDIINMPQLSTFIDSERYYGTLFKQLVHCTGHEKRLNRPEVTTPNKFWSDQYSIEKLTAEMGACFLKSFTGIGKDRFRNNAGCINGWLEKLRSDRKFIIHAASLAQQATDYIMNIHVHANDPSIAATRPKEELV